MTIIRQVQEADGIALSKLLNQLDAETPFMAMGEQNSAEALTQHLGLFIDSAAQTLLVIEAKDTKLIGFAIGITGYIRGDSHTAALVIGIEQAHVGLGLGRQLLTHIEDWAQRSALQQLELVVMHSNENAIMFYQNAGFQQQIILPGSLMSELTNNELYMIKAVNL